jgi:FAD/FMN-containing dehydrogenase
MVGLEGTAVEVDWMIATLQAEWRELGIPTADVVRGGAAHAVWARLVEFPVVGAVAPTVFASPQPSDANPQPTETQRADPQRADLAIQAAIRPSATTKFVRLIQDIDPQADVLAHAGNGILTARFASFPAASYSRQLIARLHPAAALAAGHVFILYTTATDLTRQAVWGPIPAAHRLMQSVKAQFDPHNLLNPGRFAV